jgi:lipopolysaccharide transport system permease protein
MEALTSQHAEETAPGAHRAAEHALSRSGGPGADAIPVLEFRGGPGRFSRDTLRELWAFREVLWAFTVRAVKVKYKQAAVGVGWAVLQPVVAAGLFALFLGRLTHVPSDGAPYLAFALAGMVAWTYFSGAATTSMNSLVQDQALLRKVYFPRELLPLASVAAALVDLVPALATLLIVALAYGFTPDIAWIAAPVPLLILVVAATAFGLGVSAVNVYYRDVRYALPFLLQLGLFASPVVYPLDSIPSSWRSAYAILNPIAAAIDGLRDIVLHGAWPNALTTAGALAWSIVLTIGAYLFFKRLERGFTDRI